MRWLVIGGLLFLSATADAKTRYQAYEGQDAISEGRGGTKVSVDGIDFWTTGSPPRKFQVLGIFVDRRGTGALAGNAVGSKSVAAKAREIGGDGVIIMDQTSRIIGYVSGGSATASGNTAWGQGWSAPVEKATTRMVVVKYLPSDGEAAPGQR